MEVAWTDFNNLNREMLEDGEGLGRDIWECLENMRIVEDKISKDIQFDSFWGMKCWKNITKVSSTFGVSLIKYFFDDLSDLDSSLFVTK